MSPSAQSQTRAVLAAGRARKERHRPQTSGEAGSAGGGEQRWVRHWLLCDARWVPQHSHRLALRLSQLLVTLLLALLFLLRQGHRRVNRFVTLLAHDVYCCGDYCYATLLRHTLLGPTAPP